MMKFTPVDPVVSTGTDPFNKALLSVNPVAVNFSGIFFGGGIAILF